MTPDTWHMTCDMWWELNIIPNVLVGRIQIILCSLLSVWIQSLREDKELEALPFFLPAPIVRAKATLLVCRRLPRLGSISANLVVRQIRAAWTYAVCQSRTQNGPIPLKWIIFAMTCVPFNILQQKHELLSYHGLSPKPWTLVRLIGWSSYQETRSPYLPIKRNVRSDLSYIKCLLNGGQYMTKGPASDALENMAVVFSALDAAILWKGK